MQFQSLVKSSVFATYALATVCIGPASAQEVKAGDLVLSHAWARATPGGAQVGGGYLVIENKGTTPDKLLSGSSDVARHVEVHEMVKQGDVMKMRPVSGGLTIPVGRSVTLTPGGYHLMMMGLKAPLKEGERVPITLQFEKAGKVALTLDVRGIGATDAGPAPMDHAAPGMQKPIPMAPNQKMQSH